jgi:hypothetical protein
MAAIGNHAWEHWEHWEHWGQWNPMAANENENSEIDIGNHRAPITRITRITPIARITPRFFCPMVADVNKVNEVNLVLLAPSAVL